jgi:recombinational DNA repair protein (RecF pathway)
MLKLAFMAYQTYITEAIVCGSNNSHTADRSFLLFTRDAGMIHAYAKSVREERSKQRYALQECSHIRATLVRGKSGWKITGAEPIQNLYMLATTREARAFLRNALLLLRRVIHGETPHADIFDDVIVVFRNTGNFDPRLECVLLLRILNVLGYVAPKESYRALLTPSMPFELLSTLTESDEKEYKKIIERALLESQL